MRKLGKSRKIRISVAVACCMLLTILFSAEIKNLFVLAADALSALISAEETIDTSTTIVMRTEDAYDVYETDGYYAFSVYAPSTATYTIGVTAENGSMRVNTGETISVNGTEMSVSLTEGTNVLYIMGCSSPSIQWERETCDLEPINKVCALVAGDLNQDGERTLLELIRLKKEAKAAGTLTTETLARTELADIDRDNSVTDEDARLLRELLVGNPRYEAPELCPVIVDAYLVDSTTNKAVLYDTLADAFTAASTESTANSNKEVTVTVVNPTDVSMATRIDVDGGAQIILQDDGATDNRWCRTITRTSTLKEEMFAVGNGTLTLTGGSGSDENISLILDGGAISASSNHFVDVGYRIKDEAATLNMNAGVKLHNNVNTNNGGALAVQTTFNMYGGIISGNLSKGVGGAIILLGAYDKDGVTLPASTMTMSGGIITENESTKELYSSGGVSISGGATLEMTGGEIYNNITPTSLDNNSVRKSGTSSVFTMGGSAYVDRVCFDGTSVDTYCMELTSKLTTTKDITLFFTQPLNEANPVVKRDSSLSECDGLFKLSEHMVPCQLVQDDSNENLCLRSNVTDMEKVVVGEEPVYSSDNDSDFQALEISGSDWTVQGVCADEQYLYMAIAQSPSVGCRILKVELGTWKYVDCSGEMLRTDHSNEMTYNPNTGKIYITHCMSEGAYETTKEAAPYAISIVDPDNLDAVESVIYLSDSSAYTGTTGISALAYNATQDYYVAGATGFRFGFLKGTTGEDGTYSITETTMPSTGLKGFTGYTAYTKQGVYATDTTIYANTWYDITNVTGEEQNFLTIYDWSGNYHGTQYIVNKDGSAFTREIESLFEYNGTMYMACFPKDYSVVAEIYALSGVGKAESTIEVQDSNGAVVDGVYTNLASAIAKANELGTATLILKDDVTVGAKQIITGNVTIKDDGTPRTIKRGAAYKYQMFEVGSSSASLTLQATGTDKDNPTLILDGNGVQKCSAMISHEKNGGTLSVTGPVKFTNAHINQNGGIIRTISGEASITIDGAVFTGNTVVTETLNGGLINVLGTSKVTIKDTVFDKNVISSSGAVMGAILYVNGGTANVVDSAFTSNITTTTTTSASGGLLRIDSGTLNIGKYTDEDGTTIVEGACTFTNNSFTASEGEVYGGVIAIGTNASAQVYNSTFTSNTAEFGNISVNGGATLTIGDSELANNLTTSTTEPDSKDIRATGTSGKVIVEGKVKTTVYCNNSNKLQIGSQLEAGSEITITGRAAVIAEGNTLVSFTGDNAADVMADCKANGYLKVASEDYTLVYDTTDNTAKLANVVATIEEEKYASLAEAIEAANALDSATIVLKADVTVGATQTITGNVTITDDGTARTITREEGFTNQMFVVTSDAGLAFTATGTDKTNPTLTIDGNGEVAGPSGAMVSLGTGSGTLAVNNAVKFTNANINEDGGIIRTEAGTTATVTIDGGIFAYNTVAATDDTYGLVDGDVDGDVYGGLINVAGSAEVTINNALFEYNKISSEAGLVKGGILYVEGGTLNIVGSTFASNTSTTKNAGGGLLRIDSGTLNIGKYVNAAGETIEKDCYFADNTFTGSGSNVYGGVIALGNNASAQVYNSTFNSNTAELGNISINNGATLTIGDSELNNLTTSIAEPDSKDIRVGSGGTVIFEGKVNTTVYCVKANCLEVNSQLTEDSEIIVTGPSAVIAEGITVVSFTGDNAADVMADCRTNGYLKVASEDFALVYDTTDNTAKIASVVATIEEEKYASLADAIEAANALDSATIVLKANVTVGATQTITGNVTITDDGTARTITREEGFTDQMFVVADGAGLTFTATGTDKTAPTLTIDGNGEVAGPSGAMVSLGTGSGTLAVNNSVKFTNANINEDGGIIRTEDGSTATVTINGGVFADNTAEVSGAVYGGLINVVGEAEVTISDAIFENNEISSTENGVRGGIVYIGSGTLNVVGSTFASNTIDTTSAGAGGVIAAYGGTLNIGKYVNVTNETIEGDCYFTDNTFTGNSYGGAIAISDISAIVSIYNTTIQHNVAKNGGGVHLGSGTSLTIGDCTVTDNTTTNNGSARLDINNNGTVNLEGMMKATIFCSAANSLHVVDELETESEIKVGLLNHPVGKTVLTFESAEVMAVSQAYITYANYAATGYTEHTEYILSYETTSDSQYIAKLASVVATIGDQKYASLADAITAANALDSANIVLKGDVTVGATQTITGNVTITDDGTARTITREEGFTDRMFEVASDASLTFTATGTNNESPTLTIDGNGEVAGPSGAMVSLGTGSGTLTVNNAVQFTNANINEDGGIIRTEAGSTAKVTIDGGVFAHNTVAATDDTYGLVDGDVDGDVYGGLINVAGSVEVTISNALFQNNAISSEAGLVKGGILYVEGGTVNIVGSTFEHNTSTTTNAGGGLLRIDSGALNIGKYTGEDGTTTVEGACTFTDNSFTASVANKVYGGVISLGDNASAQVYNSTFTSNTAELGNISLNNGATLTIGDSELSNNLTTSTTEPDSKDIRATGTSGGKVIFEGKVKTTVYCNNSNKLQIGSQLEAGSEITITGRSAVIAEGNTLVSFTGDNAADVMADCQTNGYLKVASEDYTLVYDTTDNTAKLASVVATIEEEKYASLADAITAANALETTAEAPATIVLKADVTVGATQAIAKNVTITDDGTARTITRGAECTAQMFDVQESASLTLAGTGTLAEDSSTVQGTITVDGNKTNVTATESMIVNAGTFSLDTNASLTNAGNENVAYGGVLYNTGTVELAGTLSGNEGARGGAIYNSGGTVTFNEGTFSENKASVHGAVIMSLNGSVEITGGTFTSNTAVDRGGVILSNGATVTISGGEFSENTAEGATGGGVFGGTAKAVLTITDGNFHDNQAIAGGGVIESNGAVTIKGGTFEKNSAFEGGVFYMNTSGALTIEAGEFYSNTTTNATDAAGGVIYIAKNTLNITGGTFGAEGKGNVSYQRGGAIYIADRDAAPTEANISIKNATFSYNSAQHGTKASGGVFFVGNNSIVDIDGCTFDYNEIVDTDTSTDHIYYYGGVIYTDKSDINVANTVFEHNSTKRGGALYIAGADVALSNCDFTDNEASYGRDIFYNNGTLTLSGKIGNVQIDKRGAIINVVGELDSTSVIEIRQLSGDGENNRVQVQFDSASATEIGAQCISYYEYYGTVNSGLTLQFDTETYQAIMK